MKKQLKITCLVLCIAAFAGGCKKNLSSEGEVLSGTPTTLSSPGDGKWDRLGFGIDITKDPTSEDSRSDVSIFNIEQLDLDFPPDMYMSKSTTTSSKQESYAGGSAFEFIKEVNKKKRYAYGANANFPIDSTKLNFNGSFEKNTSDQNTSSYSTKFSYASFESLLRIKRIYFTGDATQSFLQQYLTPNFLNNVATQSAEQLVQRYGTHIMTDITIGGVMQFDHSTGSVKDLTVSTKTKTSKSGLKFLVLKVLGLNFDSEITQTDMTKAMTETTDRQFKLKFYGGSTSGRTITFDSQANTTENINVSAWEQSITPNNAALIEVNKAVLLYEFIADPVKKQQVKTVIENYIANSQLKLAPQEVYEFYTPLYNKHANSLNPQLHILHPSGGWQPNGQPFKAYSIPHNGAVPIYQVGNNNNLDRYLTPGDFSVPNYGNPSIVFYAYDHQVPGTVPVYQFYLGSPTYGGPDHYYHTNINATAQFPGWVLHGIAFYAFPN